MDSTAQPAMLEATPSDANISNVKTIFDVMVDPRQSVANIEAFVMADPSCVRSVYPQNGCTPLHEAARRADTRLIMFFLTQGAEVDARGNAGETPLMTACERGSLYAVHGLVEGGASLTAADASGKTPMHYAALCGAVHILHYLGEVGNLDFRAVDYEGNTPLHLAVYRRHVECIKYFLRSKRVDRCAANKKGVTPMHLAVKHVSGEIAWLLLSTSNRRKLLEAKDENGCSPIDLAERAPGSKSKVLAQKLRNWSIAPANMRRLPWLIWTFFALLPALDLLLALFLFSHVHQPVGLLLALAVAWSMFFLPLAFHRIPHDAGWQNPTSMMGLVIGFLYTTLCYFIKIVPRLWPTNWIAVTVLFGISAYGIFLFYKLKRTDPGFDKVGRCDDDGRRLTIVDVAKQGKRSGQEMRSSTHASPDYFAFCTYCEIVIPDRTKHCKLCNACCNGFDHHCTWLTSCIGYNNHRMFVVFLMVLAVVNFTFLWDSFRLFSLVAGGSYNIWTLLVVGCTQEHWIMLLVICNSVSLAFSAANLIGQLSNVSRMETTFFDVAGRRAYNTARKGNPFSIQARLRLLYLFFADYKRWFNRPVLKATNACYPKAEI